MHVWRPLWNSKTGTNIAQIDGQNPWCAVIQNGAVEEWTSHRLRRLSLSLSTTTRQGCAQQLEAGNASRTAASEIIPAAIRLWWCNVLTSRDTRVDPRLRAVDTQISSLHNNRHKTSRSFDVYVVQAILGSEEIRAE